MMRTTSIILLILVLAGSLSVALGQDKSQVRQAVSFGVQRTSLHVTRVGLYDSPAGSLTTGLVQCSSPVKITIAPAPALRRTGARTVLATSSKEVSPDVIRKALLRSAHPVIVTVSE